MASRNITVANSSVSFVTALGTEQGEGYSADNIFTSEQPDLVETRIGVDGKMSAGYTPAINSLTFNFESSSRNASYFRNVSTTVKTTRTPMPIVVTIALPALGVRYTLSGVVKNIKSLPDAGKVAEPWTVQVDYADGDLVPMPM